MKSGRNSCGSPLWRYGIAKPRPAFCGVVAQEVDDFRGVAERVRHHRAQLVRQPVEIENELAADIAKISAAVEISVERVGLHGEHPPGVLEQDGDGAHRQESRRMARRRHPDPSVHRHLRADGALKPQEELHRQPLESARADRFSLEPLAEFGPAPHQEGSNVLVAHALLAVDEQPDGAVEQRVLHGVRVEQEGGAVPGGDAPEGAELGMAPEALGQGAVAGMMVPGPAIEVAPGRAAALGHPHEFQARAKGRCAVAEAAPALELQPVRGIEDMAHPGRAGLGDVQAKGRFRQHGVAVVHPVGPQPPPPPAVGPGIGPLPGTRWRVPEAGSGPPGRSSRSRGIGRKRCRHGPVLPCGPRAGVPVTAHRLRTFPFPVGVRGRGVPARAAHYRASRAVVHSSSPSPVTGMTATAESAR